MNTNLRIFGLEKETTVYFKVGGLEFLLGLDESVRKTFFSRVDLFLKQNGSQDMVCWHRSDGAIALAIVEKPGIFDAQIVLKEIAGLVVELLKTSPV